MNLFLRVVSLLSRHVSTLLSPGQQMGCSCPCCCVRALCWPMFYLVFWLSQGNAFQTSLLVSAVFFSTDQLLDWALEGDKPIQRRLVCRSPVRWRTRGWKDGARSCSFVSPLALQMRFYSELECFSSTMTSCTKTTLLKNRTHTQKNPWFIFRVNFQCSKRFEVVSFSSVFSFLINSMMWHTWEGLPPVLFSGSLKGDLSKYGILMISS